VRLAKLLLLLALPTAALAVAAAAAAGRAPRPPLEDGTLLVRDARAAIQLRMKGSVIGRLTKGSITVAESPADTTMVIVRGHEHRRFDTLGRIVYSGKGIRFRIADDRRFTVKIGGKGINFSAVGLGDGWMDGWGNPADGIFYDGTYVLNGEEFPTLPNERMRFDLAAAPAD
jgi:hypothetical protein